MGAIEEWISRKAAERAEWEKAMLEELHEMISEDVTERLQAEHDDEVKETIDREYGEALELLEDEVKAQS